MTNRLRFLIVVLSPGNSVFSAGRIDRSEKGEAEVAGVQRHKRSTFRHAR